MKTEGKIESFEEICSDDGLGNISSSENLGKRATKAEVEFDHALGIGCYARSVDSLEREATVERVAICGCMRDGTDVST